MSEGNVHLSGVTRPLTEGRVFQGWRIVAGSALMQSLQALLFWQAFGAYAALWMADFGWSRTTIAWAASLQRTESGLLGPLHGSWLQRSSPRRVFVIGVLAMGFGMGGLAVVQNFTQFMVLYLIASVGSSLCGMLTLMTVIVNWFVRFRSRALALMQLGISIGSLALPALAWALVTFGWRPVIAASGLIVLAVGLPLSRLLDRDPEALGLLPDGDPAPVSAAGGAAATDPHLPQGPAGGALRTGAFWLISSGHGAAMAIMAAVSVHFVVFATETLGLRLTTAAAFMSLMTAASVIGQVAGGMLGDRWDKRWLAGGAMIAHACAMAILATWASFEAIAIACLVHGVGWGVRGPLMASMRADYFGRAAFASVMGFSSLAVMFGSVGGPLLMGVVADRTGSYALAFAVLGVIGLAGSVAFFVLGRPRSAVV